jgi:glutathione S-transferase
MPVSCRAILYSFRRCPYAIRARMAIRASGISVELREVVFRNKPKQMLKLSAKGTVPVVQLADGQVLDESLDIMFWALGENDPMNLIAERYMSAGCALIQINDTQFKPCLDKYKYAVRFPEQTEAQYRQQCEFYLTLLNDKLKVNRYLLASRLSFADLAIFPFIRQFASVDKDWFDASGYQYLIQWLHLMAESELFKEVMAKYSPWQGLKEAPLIFNGV